MKLIVKNFIHKNEEFKVVAVPDPRQRANFMLVYHNDLFNSGVLNDFIELMGSYMKSDDIEIDLMSLELKQEQIIDLITK